MDKKTTITVGRSVQVFQIGQPEYWNKISVSKDFPEDVNVQLAIDDLFLEVEEAHAKHSGSDKVDFNTGKPISQRQPSKLKPDMATRQRHAKAFANSDFREVERLENIYDFNIG